MEGVLSRGGFVCAPCGSLSLKNGFNDPDLLVPFKWLLLQYIYVKTSGAVSLWTPSLLWF